MSSTAVTHDHKFAKIGLPLEMCLQVTSFQVEVTVKMTISVFAKRSCEQNLCFNMFL